MAFHSLSRGMEACEGFPVDVPIFLVVWLCLEVPRALPGIPK